MITPDLTTFKELARKGNIIALTETFPADLETPVSSFLKISKHAKHAFLLESAEQEEHIGRYSFLGIDPIAVYSAMPGNQVKIEKRGGGGQILQEHLLTVIEKELKDIRIANPQAFHGFSGGFVGYFSYENVATFEKVRLSKKNGPDLPLGIFLKIQDFLVFDHFRKTLSIVTLVRTDEVKDLSSAYHKACARFETYKRLLRKPLAMLLPKRRTELPVIRSNMTKSEFEMKVRKIKEYIRAGDCIQVVLSQCFSFPHPDHDFQIYRSLRSINPSPYMFYFRSGKYRLVGSSPEVLVKKTGRIACVRPIAGTRPRGKNDREDAMYEKQLKHSPKEMAEHLMLVDLGRNDLGRVSNFKSVRVENFAYVEKYSHVMHLVSNVLSRLKPGKTAADLLRATFPAGTVSGAPKIRAMQIIDELEPTARGPYAGCVGYFGYDGDMDMCITIRTLFLTGNKMYVQVGAGIVKDSNPAREYEETVNESKAVLKAIEKKDSFLMLLVIDNYDSFTYNLVQYLGELDAAPKVFRNDEITIAKIKRLKPKQIVISPGPCTPKEAGISNEVIREFSGKVPVLGVCLGHQCLGHSFGGKIIRAANIMHGKTSKIYHTKDPLFAGIPNPFTATRYHSLLIEKQSLPKELKVIAWTKEGEIMGVRHRSHPTWGVQFHPESIMTESGMKLLQNFIKASTRS